MSARGRGNEDGRGGREGKSGGFPCGQCDLELREREREREKERDRNIVKSNLHNPDGT
jgi:hypothetical protein